MAKIICICGKICSGKTTYAKRLLERGKAVLLSTDEATYDLILNEQGEFYNVFAARVNRYLRKKAVEICRAGTDVILDWGFWTKADRAEMTDYLRKSGVAFEWHYMEVTDARWEENIARRNRLVAEGKGGESFYVDEGLKSKLLALFEVPAEEEMDTRVRS